jgi:FtsP/CotA-like multicopper oxidase with cupredoxin domain
MAPGERADIIVDFTGLAGKTFTLNNDAQYPFPGGGLCDATLDGRVMQFRVSKQLSGRDNTYDPTSRKPLRGGGNQDNAIIRLANPASGTLGRGTKVDVKRQLALVEIEGLGGPIQVTLNNTNWTGLRGHTAEIAGGGSGALKDGAGNHVTETPRVGSTEVWEIINLTQDAHPIHLHLIQFQLLNRQSITQTAGAGIYDYRNEYDAKFPGGTYEGQVGTDVLSATWAPVTYAKGDFIPLYGPPLNYATPNADGAVGGNPAFSRFLDGPTIVPEPGETGWKDTIKAYPGTVTRLVARWTPQDTALGTAGPGENHFPFDPTNGPGYVWHCHILDHEDNEMMRPLKPRA